MKLYIKKSIRFFLFYSVLTSFAMVSGCKTAGENTVTKTASNMEEDESKATIDEKNTGQEDDMASVLPMAGEDTVVWKITFPEYIDIWQEPLNQLLKEKGASYQVKIEAFDVDEEANEGAVHELQKMKQANERADVIGVPSGSAGFIYTSMADKGLLLPLDDFLESGRGLEIRNTLPGRDLARCRYKGVTYGISAHLRTVGAVAYDKGLLKKYDIDVSGLSSDILENEAVLQKIKDGEGGKVIPYAYNDNIIYSLGMWKVEQAECLAYTQVGEAVNIFETEELRDKLLKLKGLKDKGLLYFAAENAPGSFFAKDEMAHREDMYESNLSYYRSSGEEITAQYVVVPDMERPQIAPYWGDAHTAVASWSQNQEYALDFLVRLYTDPDIANLILYGNEGVEYTFDGNVAARLPGNLLWAFGEHYTNALIAYPQNDTAADKMAFQEKYYTQCEPFIPDGFRFDPAPVAAEVEAVNAVYYANADGGEYSVEVDNLFNLKVADIDDALSEINRKLEEAGMDQIIQEFNQQLTEWRAKFETER